MAKKQTRRSISVNRALFDQATEIAKGRGVPLSQLTEHGLRAIMATDSPPPPADDLSASEALFGFVGWLVSRREAVTLSSAHGAAQGADLVKRFIEAHSLSMPRDGWEAKLATLDLGNQTAPPNELERLRDIVRNACRFADEMIAWAEGEGEHEDEIDEYRSIVMGFRQGAGIEQEPTGLEEHEHHIASGEVPGVPESGDDNAPAPEPAAEPTIVYDDEVSA